MSFTTPTVRTTGELITASIWNTDLVADIAYIITSGFLNINTGATVGTHLLTAGGAGNVVFSVINSSAGVANEARVFVGNETAGRGVFIHSYSGSFTTSGFAIADGGLINMPGAGGLGFMANDAAGIIHFYTGGTSRRFAIDAAGNWTIGTSLHIVDSNGTPSIASGFGLTPAISGNDYAFTITLSTTPGATGVVNFGHTFASAPVVTATYGNNVSGPPGGQSVSVEAVSTTAVTLRYGSTGTISVGDKIFVHVRGN